MFGNHNEAVMIFGRFQGITKAHEMLFHWLDCDREFTDDYVFISPTQDHLKNPLTQKQRYDFLHKVFPQYHFVVDPKIKDPFAALCWLGRLGYTTITMLVGSDRVKKAKNFLKYINHPDPAKRIPNVQEIHIVPVGVRDSQSTNLIQSVSATQVRQAVKDNDFTLFCNLTPNCDYQTKLDLYNQLSASQLYKENV
jgi:hypothetical protein